MSDTFTSPFDLIKLSIDEVVLVKCRGDREVTGRLHAFDEHLNLVLGNCTETHRTFQTDPETGERFPNEPVVRSLDMLFIRGDNVIIISPPVNLAGGDV